MSYHSSCLVKHFHFLFCDPIKIAGCSLPVNTLKQSWHSYAMSSSIFSIFTPYLILDFFTNWTLILSWSLPPGLLGNTEQDFQQVSLGRAALPSAVWAGSSAAGPAIVEQGGFNGWEVSCFSGGWSLCPAPWHGEWPFWWPLAPRAQVRCQG